MIGIDDVLDGYLMPEGAITEYAPDEAAAFDIARGKAVLEALSPADVGQAVVVQEGLVLAVEAVEGTDAMIARAANLKRDSAKAPILIKMCKHGQERRADLPTLGPDTVQAVAAAGFRGIAVEAGAAILVDHDGAVKAANAAGCSSWGSTGSRNGNHDGASSKSKRLWSISLRRSVWRCACRWSDAVSEEDVGRSGAVRRCGW